jgi:endonuclease III
LGNFLKIKNTSVDVHVHRTCNRLGWCETEEPEKTRIEIEKFIPSEYWGEINELLVGFGQVHCKSKKPECGNCSLKNVCKYYCEINEDEENFLKNIQNLF